MKRKLIEQDSFYEREKIKKESLAMKRSYQIRFGPRDKVQDSSMIV